MSVRLWELLVGVLGLVFASLLLLVGAYPIGFFFLAVTSIWLASRLRVSEPGHVAGAFAIRRGWLEYVRCLLLFAVYVGICVTLFIGRADNWQRTTPGQVANFALAGFAFLLLRELRRSGSSATNWLSGGWAEQAVGATLHKLEDQGWTVIDNFVRDDGWGNVDHAVWGPGGTFTIETKSGTLRRSHLRQAAGNAAWLKRKLGVRWVTAVVCVQEDIAPYEDGYVWVVGHRRLAEWLRARPLTRDSLPALAAALA